MRFCCNSCAQVDRDKFRKVWITTVVHQIVSYERNWPREHFFRETFVRVSHVFVIHTLFYGEITHNPPKNRSHSIYPLITVPGGRYSRKGLVLFPISTPQNRTYKLLNMAGTILFLSVIQHVFYFYTNFSNGIQWHSCIFNQRKHGHTIRGEC